MTRSTFLKTICGAVAAAALCCGFKTEDPYPTKDDFLRALREIEAISKQIERHRTERLAA